MDSYSTVIAFLKYVPSLSRKKIYQVIEELRARGVSGEQAWGILDECSKQFFTTDDNEGLRTVQRRWSPESFSTYIQQKKIQLVSYFDSSYPTQLKELKDFPLVLFTRGDVSLLQRPMVAVVGSRRPTKYGQWATEKIVAELVDHHLVIVSGFMVGVDYFAHHIAGEYGGKSIGVLGFGFDHFYPQHLQAAAEEFVQQDNLLISEYAPDQEPRPGLFPARNRIVAGLSLATVVIEAQQRSGSLITAQFALDYNKVVAAVPGPIDSVYSQGTNHLIQEGALLLTTGEELWAEIAVNAVV